MCIPLMIVPSSNSSRNIPFAGCLRVIRLHSRIRRQRQKSGRRGRVHHISCKMSQVFGFKLQSVAPFVTRYCVDVGKGV